MWGVWWMFLLSLLLTFGYYRVQACKGEEIQDFVEKVDAFLGIEQMDDGVPLISDRYRIGR